MLSQEQIGFYKENGYVLVSGLFTQGHIDELEAGMDGIIERRLEKRVKLDATWPGANWRERYGATDTVILHTHDVQAYDARWAKALFHEPLTESFSDLMGTPNVQFHHSKLFQKPKEKGSPFPMHQDAPYFPHRDHSMMAAVVMLTDATEEMGCIAVYPGSHKLGILPTWEHNHLDPEKYPLSKATLCPGKRGDVLFFHYLTIHGSGINRSQRTRKSVLIQVRDPIDKPTVETHKSHAQGMMLRGIDPLLDEAAIAGGLEAAKRH